MLKALRSPMLPLVVALAASLSGREGSRALVVASIMYLVHCLWSWWASLTIVINGMQYKADFAAKPAAPKKASAGVEASQASLKEAKSKDGFSTPRGDAESAAASRPAGPAGCKEWSPFHPFVALWKAKRTPIPGADCAPYWQECEGSIFEI